MLAISAAVSAKGPKPGEGGPGPKGGRHMENLTEEQRACVEKAACPKPSRPAEGEKPDREEMEANRECMKKAFEDCGIEMKPHDKDGEDHKKE
jgi:hypothetical protein